MLSTTEWRPLGNERSWEILSSRLSSYGWPLALPAMYVSRGVGPCSFDARLVLILFLGVCGVWGVVSLSLLCAAGLRLRGRVGFECSVKGAGVSFRSIIMLAVGCVGPYAMMPAGGVRAMLSVPTPMGERE